MRNITRAALLGSAIVIAACSSSTGPTGPTPTGEVVAVESIEVTPSVVQLASVGSTRRLAVRVIPTEATERRVTWKSSNPAVASVDASGLVTAVTSGSEVTITATSVDGGHEATAKVRVGTLPQVVGNASAPH